MRRLCAGYFRRVIRNVRCAGESVCAIRRGILELKSRLILRVLLPRTDACLQRAGPALC